MYISFPSESYQSILEKARGKVGMIKNEGYSVLGRIGSDVHSIFLLGLRLPPVVSPHIMTRVLFRSSPEPRSLPKVSFNVV